MSTPIKDGGQAFPCQESSESPNHPGYRDVYASPGMTLRDWFAGQALAGICANSTFLIETRADNWAEKVRLLADDAYTAADAMIAAREAKQ